MGFDEIGMLYLNECGEKRGGNCRQHRLYVAEWRTAGLGKWILEFFMGPIA